jgi:hypothetical protein
MALRNLEEGFAAVPGEKESMSTPQILILSLKRRDRRSGPSFAKRSSARQRRILPEEHQEFGLEVSKRAVSRHLARVGRWRRTCMKQQNARSLRGVVELRCRDSTTRALRLRLYRESVLISGGRGFGNLRVAGDLPR